MVEKIVATIVILICALRVIGYGVYTVRDKNVLGGVGLFALAAIVFSSSIYFFLV